MGGHWSLPSLCHFSGPQAEKKMPRKRSARLLQGQAMGGIKKIGQNNPEQACEKFMFLQFTCSSNVDEAS